MPFHDAAIVDTIFGHRDDDPNAVAIEKAAKLLSNAKFPVILSGAGVVIGDAIEETKNPAEKLDSPVCSGFQHNDSFPGSHPLAVGPLGYNGSKAAMN